MTYGLTAIIEREGDGYLALSPELDIASQGDSIEQARDNLREALELCFETAAPEEIGCRPSGEVFVAQVEIVARQAEGHVRPAGVCSSGSTRFGRG
jgi:predicted RNase H-like HicB family nuclease